jgi:NAD-dependent SIR2 family protein deacetylase
MTDFSEVIRKIRKGKAVILWGAGASLKAGAPSVSAIVQKLKDDLSTNEEGIISSTDLSEVSQLYENIFGRDKLIAVLQELFNFTPSCLDDQNALTCIPQIPRIYTTNYDDLLEKAFGQEGQVIHFNSDIVELDESKTQIIKLHGDFYNQQGIILTQHDYFNYWNKPKGELVWNLLKHDFANKHIIFIGYSLSDYNIQSLLEKIRELSGLNPKGHYIITPSLPKFQKEILAKLGVAHLEGKADEFFTQLFKVFDNELHKDLKHKWISPDEFNKYTTKRHNFYSEITSTPEENSIGTCHGLNKSTTQITFSILNKGDNISSNNLPRYNSTVKSNGFVLPCTRLKTEDLNDIAITFNNFKIADKDDIRQLLIAPSVNKRRFVISVPSFHFREKVNAVAYPNGDSDICDIDCKTFHLKVIFSKTKTQLPQLNIDFNEHFTSLSEANHWLKLYQAIESDKPIAFDTEVGRMELGHMTSNDSNQEPKWAQIQSYYSLLEQIEDAAGISFEKYDAYSEDLIEAARLVLSHVTSCWIDVRITKPLYLTTEFVPNENQELIEGLGNGQQYLFGMTETLLNDSFTFLGHTFPIRMKEKAFPESTLVYIKPTTDGDKKIKIKIENRYMIRALVDESSALIK